MARRLGRSRIDSVDAAERHVEVSGEEVAVGAQAEVGEAHAGGDDGEREVDIAGDFAASLGGLHRLAGMEAGGADEVKGELLVDGGGLHQHRDVTVSDGLLECSRWIGGNYW